MGSLGTESYCGSASRLSLSRKYSHIEPFNIRKHWLLQPSLSLMLWSLPLFWRCSFLSDSPVRTPSDQQGNAPPDYSYITLAIKSSIPDLKGCLYNLPNNKIYLDFILIIVTECGTSLLFMTYKVQKDWKLTKKFLGSDTHAIHVQDNTKVWVQVG